MPALQDGRLPTSAASASRSAKAAAPSGSPPAPPDQCHASADEPRFQPDHRAYDPSQPTVRQFAQPSDEGNRSGPCAPPPPNHLPARRRAPPHPRSRLQTATLTDDRRPRAKLDPPQPPRRASRDSNARQTPSPDRSPAAQSNSPPSREPRYPARPKPPATRACHATPPPATPRRSHAPTDVLSDQSSSPSDPIHRPLPRRHRFPAFQLQLQGHLLP